MRDPLRLSPFRPAAPGQWPPLAPEPPHAAEVAAHVAGQVAAGLDAAANSQRRHPEEPAERASRRTHNGPACFETRPPAAPQHDAVAEPKDAEPFHPVAPFGRPSEEVRAAVMRLVDGIGLHLVCPVPRCRRAKRCRDADPAQLPLCFWLHRGTCRFVVACLAGGTDTETPTAGRSARAGQTLLGGLRQAGVPIERLARSREDGADEWTWEMQPEACAVVKARRPKTTEP